MSEQWQRQTQLVAQGQGVRDGFVEFAEDDTERSVPERFEQQVRLHGSRVAVKSAGRTLTYDEFNALANQVAWTLLDRLVAVAIDVIAMSAETTMATSGKLSAAQARACLADLQALQPLPGMIEAVDQCERFCSLDCVMIFAQKGARKGFGWLRGLGIGGRRLDRLNERRRVRRVGAG